MTKLCDYYVINGPVDDTMESGAKNAVSKSDGGEECAIFLTTYGGSADVAYRVMRLFQRRYKNIGSSSKPPSLSDGGSSFV